MEKVLVLSVILSCIVFVVYLIGVALFIKRRRFYPIQRRPVSLILVELLCGILFGVVQIPIDFEILPCNFRELWHIGIMSVLSTTLMAGSYQAFVKFKFTSDSSIYLSESKRNYSFDQLSEQSWALRHMKRFSNIFLLKVVVAYTVLFLFVTALLSKEISPELWQSWRKRDECPSLTITTVALVWLELQFLVFECTLAYYYHRDLKHLPDSSKLNQELALGLSLWTSAIFFWIAMKWFAPTDDSELFPVYLVWILYFLLVRLPLVWATYNPQNTPEPVEQKDIPINFDLTHVLRTNLVIKEKYKEFLQGEFATENMLFWEEIEIFRSVPEYLRERERKKVWELYFLPSSPLEINISDFVRNDALSKMESSHPDTFDAVQREVAITMQSDSFMRFMRTPLFQRLPSKDRKLSM